MVSRVFVDTSAFKAIIDRNDDFNSKAEAVIKTLVAQEYELVTSNYVVDECATLLRIKCGLNKALFFRDYIMDSDPRIILYRVMARDEVEAWKMFENKWSGLSFTDCVSFAMMKRLGITQYFGFDQHFDRAGFDQAR